MNVILEIEGGPDFMPLFVGRAQLCLQNRAE